MSGGEPMWRRYLRLLGPDAAADARDELRFHLEEAADELEAAGMDRAEAEREARRRFGDVGAVEREGARMGRARERAVERRDFVGGVMSDFKFAMRRLRRERGFALVVVSIVALGIAANTAVFSVVNTLMLRPLPFGASGRLVWMESGKASQAKGKAPTGLSSVTYTVDAYEEYARQTRVMERVACYNPFLYDSDYTLLGLSRPVAVEGVMVSGNFFETLGVGMALGRGFSQEETKRGGPGAAVVSYAFWKRQLGGDAGVLGRTLELSKRGERERVTVVGVLEEGFDFGPVFAPGVRTDLFVPAVMDDLRESGNTLSLVGRMRRGATLGDARAEADVVWARIHASHKEWWGDYTSTLTGLKEKVSGRLRPALRLLWGAAGMVLLIVVVNLSNLMLGRALGREREFALRQALGAGRGRLLGQLLMESAVLALCGAALGLGLAFGLVRFLAGQASVALPLLSMVRVDGAALGWTAALTAALAIVLGLAPAAAGRWRALSAALKDGGAGVTAGRGAERTRMAMVMGEVALASVLVVGAGLLLRSFVKVLDVDMGFEPARAAVMRVDYEDGFKLERRGPLLEQLVKRAEQVPGVEAAGIADMLPLGRNRSWGFRVKGVEYDKDDAAPALVRIVTPGYLRAMGMRLAAGRDFAWSDTVKSEAVMIVNEAAARKYWPGGDALSRPAEMGPKREVRVVGVVKNVVAHSVEAPAEPEMYLPAMQSYPSGAELVVRTRMRPEALAGALLRAVREVTPAQAATEFRTVETIVERATSPRRFFAWLVAGFAGLGLVLAGLGIYGVMAYAVERRRREIGLRMALGATPDAVERGVLRRAAWMAGGGILVGGAASLGMGRWVDGMLYGTKAWDPATYAAVVLVLGAAALAAGLIPARRAARVDPMVALRSGE